MIKVERYWVLYDESSNSYLKDPNILRPLYQTWGDGKAIPTASHYISKGFEMTQNVFEAVRFKASDAMLQTNLKHIQVYFPFVKFVEYTLTQKG